MKEVSQLLPLYKGRKGLMAASKCLISHSWASQGGIQVCLIEETRLVPSPALYPHLSCSNLANNEFGPKPFLPGWLTTHLRLLSLYFFFLNTTLKKIFFIVIQLQLSSFSPHPSTLPQPNPPLSPTSRIFEAKTMNPFF